jgi:hypothetical protein
MKDKKHIDDSDIQQDSPAEALSEVTDPDGSVDEDLRANRAIVAPLGNGQGTVPAVTAAPKE